jgi:hypothetical protein
MIVMARLVRATHDLRDDNWNAAAPLEFILRDLVFMGPPDKPGDDEEEEISSPR